jgi:hypothetical protein
MWEGSESVPVKSKSAGCQVLSSCAKLKSFTHGVIATPSRANFDSLLLLHGLQADGLVYCVNPPKGTAFNGSAY